MNVWEIVQNVSDFFWDWPLPILLLAVGLFTTIGFRGRQTFSIPTLFQNSLGTAFRKNDGGRGSITSFASAMTSLGNCVGTGNIGGVASAIAIGGPGAVFWMWVSGILGMSTKAAEIIIGQRYRVKFSKSRDEYMCNRDFVLDHALGWRKLAIFSAVSVLITQPINGLVQTNAVSSSIEEAFGVPQQITVWIVVILLTVTVLGGLKRISHIAETLVPFMCVMYIVAVVILLVLN